MDSAAEPSNDPSARKERTPESADKSKPNLTPGKAISVFQHDIDAIRKSLDVLREPLDNHAKSRLEDALACFGMKFPDDDKPIEEISTTAKVEFPVGRDDIVETLVQTIKDASHANAAIQLTAISFLIMLISRYDAYLANLLRSIYLKLPALADASQRTLTLAQLSEFQSIDDARRYVVGKEIESTLRESHSDQFQQLEKRFGIQLRKDLQSWGAFIEITERRNLLAHADGIVSDQYLKVCEAAGYKWKKSPPKVGSRLTVNSRYLKQAIDVVFEIGVKLGHVLWRKIDPDAREKADSHLSAICFDAIRSEKYELTEIFYSFWSTSIRKYSTTRMQLMCIVNRAQAHKWAGRGSECDKLLIEQDWSAASNDLLLCKEVLLSRFDVAARLMKEIGATGSVSRGDYGIWPVFREFRKSEQFLKAYQAIFGDGFREYEIIEAKKELARLFQQTAKAEGDVKADMQAIDGLDGKATGA